MLSDRVRRIQHRLIALFSVFAILASPWVSMRRVVPQSPGLWDYAHLGVGLALTVLAGTFLLTSIAGGRWRQCFPWAAGELGELKSDLAGIARLRLPSAGGAGLLSALQGLLLIGLLAAALTGVGWLLADGGRSALAWRDWHMLAADVFAWLLVTHVVASALHLLDFVRD